MISPRATRLARMIPPVPGTLLRTPPSSTPLARCCFLHTTPTLRDNYFDTHQFVQRLEDEGLSRAQAEGLMTAIAQVIDESVKNMSRNMVTKSDQEKYSYTQKVDFAQLKSEVQLLEKNDVALMKADNDRLVADVEKLKARLREEIVRTQAGVRLDLNLEKGRIRDEASMQELKIREVDTRVESEISGLRTAIEQSKQNTLQYLVTVATGCAALLMAYMRFRI
ncbi:hypothetical protein RhiJN_01836 [Ceratobasidium sp. AG-Ba]|nr:hypothetical protein RhiJN_01836 [Ceratobasidium sp. AG-Ba]QRW02776.1 hypothetical protein RhiLY_01775 [Ceratobasidium sp. AG-Ba]